MKTKDIRVELIRAILDLPEDHLIDIWQSFQKGQTEDTFDITDDLLEGIRQLGLVLRQEKEAVSAWDLLDEL
ncbi:MAG TPA: hypothetical protein PLV45_10700 [bacterium]|nr:hypothetical protein [bacterium]